MRELTCFTLAVRLRDVQLVFIGTITEVGDPLAIRAPHRVAFSGVWRECEVARVSLFSRQGPDVTPGLDCHTLPTRGDGIVADAVTRVDASRTDTRAVTWNRDFNGSYLT